jgi:23S rRNA U2552 (ribose-2'-O)-methylase RlmE/FtsJ
MYKFENNYKCKPKRVVEINSLVINNENFILKEYVENKLLSFLNCKKNEISNIGPEKWCKTRKYYNMYENPGTFKPVSRAYFKIKEIIIDFNIKIEDKIFCIAEAPGGFLECIVEMEKKQNIENYKIYTVSLLSEQSIYKNKKSIPSYHKNIIENKNIKILQENKGDITKIDTFFNILKNVQDIPFITADGGISENGDFNNKEKIHINLIYSEIMLVVFCLSDKGNCVIKVFDIFTKISVDFVMLLSYLFQEIYLHKPLTSRSTNSEKYIVCKNFRKELLSVKLRNYLFNMFCKINNNEEITSLFKENDKLNANIKKCNNYFINHKIDAINDTLNFIKKNNNNNFSFYYKNENFDKLKKNNNNIWVKNYS